jgi:hypothetical protein
MNWLWAYFRRKVAEAILAGVHDALASENGATGLSEEQAAKAARALAGIGNLGAIPAPGENGAAQARPQLAAPREGGPDDHTEAPRRGPGRPRKFQEPPE